MGKRFFTLVLLVAAMALLIAGVAAAAGGSEQPVSDETSLSTSTSLPPDTVAVGVEDVSTTDTTAVVEDDDEDVGEVGEVGQVGNDGDDTEGTEATTEHPDNFGKIISEMRHNGDHTPAAIVKNPDKQSGWYHNHVRPTSTTAPPTTDTPPES